MAKGDKKRKAPAAIPLIPTLISVTPELTVGLHAAADIASGVEPAAAGAHAVSRLKALYGAGPEVNTTLAGVPVTYGLKENATAKIAAVAIHWLAKKGGLRFKISKRFTLL